MKGYKARQPSFKMGIKTEIKDKKVVPAAKYDITRYDVGKTGAKFGFGTGKRPPL